MDMLVEPYDGNLVDADDEELIGLLDAPELTGVVNEGGVERECLAPELGGSSPPAAARPGRRARASPLRA